MKIIILFFTVLSLLFSLASVHAGQYYRYKNEKGQLVMEQSIPPEIVRQGYDVLSDTGRLIETVPPALTQEQIDKLDKVKASAYLRKQLDAKQKETDELLLTLYSGPEDIQRALRRKLQELNGLTKIEEGNIHRLQVKLGKLQERAANDELAGREVPETLITEIQSIETLITQSTNNIAATDEEKRIAKDKYAQEEARIRTLLRLPPTVKDEQVTVDGP